MVAVVATALGREHLDAAIAALPDRATTDALIPRYIQRDPVRVGRHAARVEVGDASVHVWALIGHLRDGGGVAQTAADYRLPEDAVVAAVAFYARHGTYIDAKLLLMDDVYDDWDVLAEERG